MLAGAVGWMAVALGAVAIEKHLRLADDETSVDVGHSLTPQHFARMVTAIRRANAVLGDGVKRPQPAELHDRLWARRSPTDWLRPTETARQGAWA